MVEIGVILSLLFVAVALYFWTRARSRKLPRYSSRYAAEHSAEAARRVDPSIQLELPTEQSPQHAESQITADHSYPVEDLAPSTYGPVVIGDGEKLDEASRSSPDGDSDDVVLRERQVLKSDENSDNREAQQATHDWYLPGEVASVGNLTLTAGWIYVGVDLPAIDNSGNDPCLINLQLEIGSPSPGMTVNVGNTGRKPSISYAKLSPGHRRDYLEWLALDRASSEVADFIPLLFLSGIERRVIVDINHEIVSDDELAALVEELLRLSELFSRRKKVVSAANRLIGLCLAKTTTVDPSSFDIDFFVVDHFEWNRLQFAEKILSGVYVGEPALAVRYVLSSPDLDVKARYGDGYSADLDLFEARFAEAYPDGLLLVVSDHPLEFNYDCLNESIRGRFELICDDVQAYDLSPDERNKLIDLWESSRRDVAAHRRYVSQQRNENEQNGLTELSLLPRELLIRNTAFVGIRDLLEKTVTAGQGTLPIVTLLNLVGEDTTQLRKKTARMVSELCESAGFGIAPDARIHGIKPIITRNIQVFRKRLTDTSTDFSPTFNLNVLLVRLSALVSKSDDRVVYQETLAIESFIENDSSLSPFERSSLVQLLRWCLENKSAMAGIKKLTSNLSIEMRELVWERLVSVAKSDRQLHSAEVAKLDQLYDVLDLDPSQKLNRVNLVRSEEESITNVTTQGSSTSGEPNGAQAPNRVDESKDFSQLTGGASLDTTPGKVPLPGKTSMFDQGVESTQSVQSKWAQVTRGKKSSKGSHAGTFGKTPGGESDRHSEPSGYTSQYDSTQGTPLADAEAERPMVAVSGASDSSSTMKSDFLDLEKLAQLEEEHARAGELLDSIFTDDHDEETEPDHYDGHELDAIETTGSNSEYASEAGTDVNGLDAKHSRLYMTLRGREEWLRTEYLDYCKELGLMPDGALEVINDWACELTGEPLLESDDKTVYLNRDIGSELEND